MSNEIATPNIFQECATCPVARQKGEEALEQLPEGATNDVEVVCTLIGGDQVEMSVKPRGQVEINGIKSYGGVVFRGRVFCPRLLRR